MLREGTILRFPQSPATVPLGLEGIQNPSEGLKCVHIRKRREGDKGENGH
jgi:hypothetical protein